MDKVQAAFSDAGLAGNAVEINDEPSFGIPYDPAKHGELTDYDIPEGFVAVEPTKYEIPNGFKEVIPSYGVHYDPAMHGDLELPTKVMLTELDEAKGLLNLIGTEESNSDYNIAYGQKKAEQDFSDMTINQVLQWQADYVEDGTPSSAVGKYQIIRKTLRELVKATNLTGSEKFTPQLQDELAVALMNRRGYSKWLSGELDTAEFANNLAKEWASLPVVSGSKRGRSYYSGDGLNESRISVDALLKVLGEERGLLEEVVSTAPVEPVQQPVPSVPVNANRFVAVPSSLAVELDKTIEGEVSDGLFKADDGTIYKRIDGQWMLQVNT